MRIFISSTMLLASMSIALAQWGAGATDQKASVILRSDGSAILRSTTTMSRAQAEQSAQMMERYAAQAEAAADEPPEETAEPAEPKPLTDAELAGKLRKTSTLIWGLSGQEHHPLLERIDVTAEHVTTVWTNQFSSISSLLDDGRMLMMQAGFNFEKMRLEKDADGRLKLTIQHDENLQQMGKNALQAWKRSQMKLEVRLTLPGKVITSDFPSTQDNMTWFEIDSSNEESLRAALKFYTATQAVVVAELGGLSLDNPIESTDPRKLWRGRQEDRPEGPVVDAGPGFLAEAQSIQINTTHRFPGAPAPEVKGRDVSSENSSLSVQVQIFPPKGKTIKSISHVKLLRAVDDLGGEIKPLNGDADEEELSMETYSSGGENSSGAVPVQLAMGLPAPQAQSLEEVSAEAILVTVGQWRELSITNIHVGYTNEIDLQPLLEGAHLSIAKAAARQSQMEIQATLTGPAGVRDIEISGPNSEDGMSNLHSYDSNVSTKDKLTTRKVNISAYEFSDQGTGVPKNVTLRLRSPQDLKRERFRFKLTGLDLF